MTVTHLLLTHHHADHVAENGVYKERFGVEILAHPLEAEELLGRRPHDRAGRHGAGGGRAVDRRAAHPGPHRRNAQLRGQRRATCSPATRCSRARWAACSAPGSTTFEDLKHSIMDVLMTLPPETRLHPGHTDPTTVGDEWENNAFVRVWRGLDAESDGPLHRLGASPRRSSSGGPTTTAGTRPGCAGTSRARTTSCPAPRWCGLTCSEPCSVRPERSQHRHRALPLGPAHGPLPGPERAYSMAARLSCSASGAAAGSPCRPRPARWRWRTGTCRGRCRRRSPRAGCRRTRRPRWPGAAAARPHALAWRAARGRGAEPRAWRAASGPWPWASRADCPRAADWIRSRRPARARLAGRAARAAGTAISRSDDWYQEQLAHGAHHLCVSGSGPPEAAPARERGVESRCGPRPVEDRLDRRG